MSDPFIDDIVCAFRWHLMNMYVTAHAVALHLHSCLLHMNIFSTQNTPNYMHIFLNCPFVRVGISFPVWVRNLVADIEGGT